jgi:predicted dehydrogenase
MEAISFAVIGSGFMGALLARAAAELPHGRCVAAMDVDAARAESLVADVGGTAFTDYEEMLYSARPDAVIVATPERDHRAPAVAAAEAGVHLFLEKPIATTLTDADAIIQATAAAGVKLMVGHILRFEPAYAMIKQAVDAGNLGRLLSIYARRVATIEEARRLGGRVSPVSYIGVHDFDQILWYHPQPVKSVYARAVYGRVWEELGTYDSAWITIEFEDGTLGIHEVGWCLPTTWAGWQTPATWGGFGDVRMNVIGTEGVSNLNLTPMDLYAVDREGWKLPDTRHWPQMHGRVAGAVKHEVEHFFASIVEDVTPLVTGRDGRGALEIMLAAEQSIAEDQIVQLPL